MKKVRRQLGLTQGALARLAGVSQSLVAKMEAGRVDPSFSVMRAVSEALVGLQRGRARRAEEVMSASVVAVAPENRVEEAVELMRSHGFSQLPVLAGERVVGSVSERTFLNRLMGGADPRRVLELRVGEVMEDSFPLVHAGTSVEVLYPLLEFFPAVLVTKRGRMVGIVTKADLLKLG